MTSRQHRIARRARYSRRDHAIASEPARFARSGRPIFDGDVLRDSPPFQGWMPTVALGDGRLAVRLEDLPGFPDAPLLWPVVELVDGDLAVLVSDLRGGAVQ